eukprot:scaffold537_cov241-Pinguiococcus_pyrenoidosus.AAC.5
MSYGSWTKGVGGSSSLARDKPRAVWISLNRARISALCTLTSSSIKASTTAARSRCRPAARSFPCRMRTRASHFMRATPLWASRVSYCLRIFLRISSKANALEASNASTFACKAARRRDFQPRKRLCSFVAARSMTPCRYQVRLPKCPWSSTTTLPWLRCCGFARNLV